MAKTIDITTLTGFSSLAVGTHAISVVAKGTGKIDSVKSNTINYSIYSITGTGSNCTIQEGSGTATANYSGKCGQSQTKVLNISCTSSFVLPSSMTITGAVYARQTTTTATVTITTPSANVNFSITATALRTVSATATNATVNGNTTYSGTVLNGGTLTLSLGANGTSHKLPTSVTVAGTTVPAGTATTVSGICTATYTRTSNTAGTLQLATVVANIPSITIIGEVTTIQLDAPTNVSMSGFNITFTEVEHADSYGIYEGDSTSIGEYTPPNWEDPVQEGTNLTITQTYSANQNGSTVAIQ